MNTKLLYKQMTGLDFGTNPEQFAAIRRSIGLTQSDIGEILGVSHGAISNMENGHSNNPVTLYGYYCILKKLYKLKKGKELKL